MTNTNRPTVQVDALIATADTIERQARESLPSWIILGQTEKFDARMADAANYRRAAGIKSVQARREFLRSVGIPA